MLLCMSKDDMRLGCEGLLFCTLLAYNLYMHLECCMSWFDITQQYHSTSQYTCLCAHVFACMWTFFTSYCSLTWYLEECYMVKNGRSIILAY